jgi:hypothetical protein
MSGHILVNAFYWDAKLGSISSPLFSIPFDRGSNNLYKEIKILLSTVERLVERRV